MAHTANDELLLVIVDATRPAWSALDAAARSLLDVRASSADSSSSSTAAAPLRRRSTFPEFMVALELFLSAFACSSRRNRLAVLAYNGAEGGFLYPPPPSAASPESPASADDLLRPAVIKRHVRAGLLRLRFGGSNDGLLEAAVLAAEVAAAEAEAEAEAEAGSAATPPPTPPPTPASLGLDSRLGSLGSCLALALCFAQRQRAAAAASGGRRLPARVLAFQASADVPAHYIAVINSVYSARKLAIPVDSCTVGEEPSVFLQQAAYLTEGLHVRPEVKDGHHEGLLQLLVTLLLPDARSRGAELLLPLRRNVNLRAHCFCHKRHCSIAWLCYVCLSVWCAEAAVCDTCGTRMGEGGGGGPAAGGESEGEPDARLGAASAPR